MKIGPQLPCVLAFGVVIPLVIVPFLTWYLFYERAISNAEEAGITHLERVALDTGTSIQQILVNTDNVAYSMRMAITTCMPWFLQNNASLNEKPLLWSHLNAVRITTPSHMYAMVCVTENGAYVNINRRSDTSWGYAFGHKLGTPAGQIGTFYVNISGFDADTSRTQDFFAPNETFNTLRLRPQVVAALRTTTISFFGRSFYQEMKAEHMNGSLYGWSQPDIILGGPLDGGLVTAAWFSLANHAPADPFMGMCSSWLYLGDLHQVLAGPVLGSHGMLVLLDDKGYVFATSRPQDAQGGVSLNSTKPSYLPACQVPGFEVICDMITTELQAHPGGRTGHSKDLNPTIISKRVSGQERYTLFYLTSRAFTGYLMSVGRGSDFDGGIRADRKVAIAVSVVVVVFAAAVITLVFLSFTRPLLLVSDVLSQLAEASNDHARKLELHGIGVKLPERDWTRIVQSLGINRPVVCDDQSCPSLCLRGCGAKISCNRIVLERLGGPEIKQLHNSLCAMVNSLSELGNRATEQEQLRRKFIRYIFHEVCVPINAVGTLSSIIMAQCVLFICRFAYRCIPCLWLWLRCRQQLWTATSLR